MTEDRAGTRFPRGTRFNYRDECLKDAEAERKLWTVIGSLLSLQIADALKTESTLGSRNAATGHVQDVLVFFHKRSRQF